MPYINQPTYEDLRANEILPPAQRASINFLRPYKGYSVIEMFLSDTNSNYNSLQVYATKRKKLRILISTDKRSKMAMLE
jgi:hypothetical protein